MFFCGVKLVQKTEVLSDSFGGYTTVLSAFSKSQQHEYFRSSFTSYWLHRKLPHKYTFAFLVELVENVYLKLVSTFKNLSSIVSNFQTAIYAGDQRYGNEKLSGYSKK